MSNFTELRGRLAKTRADKDAFASALETQRAQLKAVERRIDELRRLGESGASARELAVLQKQAQALTAKVDRQRELLGGLRADATGLLGQLTALADPTKQLAELSDSTPILLFPLRLETRFRSGPGPTGAPVPQLWIRVYPDDCQVDGFEELLTEAEVENAASFWASMWRAAGVEAQQRGAWRSLVGSSSSGRATYVLSKYQPTNLAEKPAKAKAQDVVLVIVPRLDVTAVEQDKAFTYWKAVWKAEGDAIQEGAALATLRAAVGASRADEILAGFAPEPQGQEPPKGYSRAGVDVGCAVLRLPAPPTTKTNSWTQAPKAAAMPDRLVAMLFNGATQAKPPVIGKPIPDGLATGPDPSLPKERQIRLEGDDLKLNDDLRWMEDFEHAVSVGMGFKIDLTPAEAAAGFDRLLVLGVRISSDEQDGKRRLETLIEHHYSSKHGFGLVPQGSPTNNTESEGAAHSWVDDADAAYDILFGGQNAYADTSDPLDRRDGQWLAHALGIDGNLIRRVPHAAGHDQGEARAMNVALWPATFGYALEEMATPVFSNVDIATTRAFFTRFVSGRGPVPAFRVGRQPYGILPTMAFSRYRSTTVIDDVGVKRLSRAAVPGSAYLQRLHTLLSRMDATWKTLSSSVAHVGKPGDPHQTLLDIVGLHPGTVEYHQRYAESFDQIYNKLVLQFGQFWALLMASWLRTRGQDLLAQLGADPSAQPPILEKFFYGGSPLLNGPVVDDVPLSESVPIRKYTADKKQNYLEWLSASSLDVIRRQDFGGSAAPTALLYLMLRHAMMLGQWDAGIRMMENRQLIDPTLARLEPSFIHVQTAQAAQAAGQSKFQHLYAPQPQITGDQTTTLAEYVLRPSVLAGASETASLREVVNALKFLQDAPTARLERVFAEHIDCCSYRLDAWKTGLTATRLEEMRFGSEISRPGIYLGAFGWLENLRPRPTALSPVTLDPELAKVFQRPGEAPLRFDPANAGYIHAPSLNQAAAAAILKNAYRVNATPGNPEAMAVNLSSARVRRALNTLEGVRNGQTLAALLGYDFERGLHDGHGLAEVDKFTYPLRGAFPLVANKLKSTQVDESDITLLEARNVIDGVQLVNQIRKSGQTSYPFGLVIGSASGQVPNASPGEKAAINAEADALLNSYDALADLVMAESVYQSVLGNFDRAAANTTAFSKGTHPPELQVVETPRGGLALTHRIVLHLDPTVDPAVSPSSVPMTPRATAEAPLNAWLSGRVPQNPVTHAPTPDGLVVQVTYSTPVLTAPKTITLSQTDLKLQPIDLLYLVNLDLEQAMSELDDRVLQAVRYGSDAHADMTVSIAYTQSVTGKVTFFELSALMRSLRSLLLRSRPIGPTDMALPLEATSDDAVWDVAELAGRIGGAISGLTAQRDALQSLQSDASDLDAYAQKVSTAFLQTALFGIPQTGTGSIHGDIRSIYDAIATKVQAVVTRWIAKDADYQALMTTWPMLTSDDERFAMLRQAERVIAASPTMAVPADPVDFKAAVEATKLQFDATLLQLEGLLGFATSKLVDYAAAVDAVTPLLAVHDVIPFDIADQKGAIVTLRATLVDRVTSVTSDLTLRIVEASPVVALPATTTSSQARVQELLAAAKRVLGDEFLLIPRFVLAAERSLEVQSCLSASSTLLGDLTAPGPRSRKFPVDDWLYGAARVRDKLADWENASILGEAFGARTVELTPLQLPFRADDRWVALEFDKSTAPPGNRLLYTAHLPATFSPSATLCGLLLDEWPEVIPVEDVMSGVAFHFDQPNSEPPQTILLAVPPELKGRWAWDDLVATLNETLDSAKARAVEPAQVDASSYGQFLPATLMAVTLYQITIATNLGLNNRIYDRIGG